jgi:HPt (histidine-containing phosphotransfer) domain-containing protein
MRTARTRAHKAGDAQQSDLPVVPPLFTHELARALLEHEVMRSAATSVPVLDECVLSELQTLGDDVVAEIFDLFLADVPSRLARLQRAIDDRSRDGVLREAHGLKGSALGVGAARLASLCSAIEHDAREGRLDQAVARSSRLEPAFVEVREALRQTAS